MGNPFVHAELNTNDPAKAKAFYSKLFDWKLQDAPMPDGSTYTMIDVGEGTGGGMLKNMAPGLPSHWLAYIGVDDVATTTRNARELGAKVLVDKKEIGGFGWMSILQDPTGAIFALWQADPSEKTKK